jgi:hypothetical protein
MTCSWFLSLKVGYWVFKLTTSSDPGLGYLLINLFLVPVMWNEGEGLCVDGGSVRICYHNWRKGRQRWLKGKGMSVVA